MFWNNCMDNKTTINERCIIKSIVPLPKSEIQIKTDHFWEVSCGLCKNTGYISEAIPTLIHPHWRLHVLLIRILMIRHDVISSVRTAGGNRRIEATLKGITRLLFLSELQLPCSTPHRHACVIVWLFMFPSFPESPSEKRQALGKSVNS